MLDGPSDSVKSLDNDRGGPHPVLAQQLLHLVRWFDDSLTATMRLAGHEQLGRRHILVMANIHVSGTSESDLARHAGVTRQAMHQLVRELVGLGVLEVVAAPGDRRSKLVRPTERGASAMRLARETLQALEDELGRRIGEDHVAALRRATSQPRGAPVTVHPQRS